MLMDLRVVIVINSISFTTAKSVRFTLLAASEQQEVQVVESRR